MQDIPVLMVQDPLSAARVVMLDYHPPLLPVSMDINGVDLLTIRAPAMSAGAVVLPPEREPCSVGGLAWVDLPGVGCYSNGGPGNGH